MNISNFVQRQYTHILQRGQAEFFRKIKLSIHFLFNACLFLLLFIPSLSSVLIIRLIKPLVLVRIGELISSRIGHFAANTELYLCERDSGINKPSQRYLDLHYIAHFPISNYQLAIMWKRVLHVWPNWILAPIAQLNHVIPGGAIHEIGNNTQHDRDVHNLLERFSPHIKFSAKEVKIGEANLLKMGIPLGKPIVCLTVRDSAFLNYNQPGNWSYHNYRDSNIQNYVLAAEELANQGFYVIRMGAKVNDNIKSTHPNIIDYATNGMRTDFMDIYLGSKCTFCISTGTGWDAIPIWLFRKPSVFTNFVPLGFIPSFLNNCLIQSKKHFSSKMGKELTLVEIFKSGIGFSTHSSDFESQDILLFENSPEEIKDIVIEMVERMKGSWYPLGGDEDLQQSFWELFSQNSIHFRYGQPLHGSIRSRFGSHFLRNNTEWLK